MARRIVSARDQVEMLSPWRTAAEDPTPPSIHDIMPGRFSDGNGRWDYRHQETSGDSYLRHEYGIHPVTSPASHTFTNDFGRTYTVHYDPTLTGGQLPRPGKWGYEWDDYSALRNEITDLAPPPGMLWRGMSREEYEQARDRGYFESDGNHNIGDIQKGHTFFSTDPEQAANYATWFAPPAYKPTFTHPGYVVGIPDRPDAPRGAIPGQTEIGSTEVGLPGRIPFSEATHHYVGQVSTLRPGMQGVSEGWHGWERSGGSHPSSTIMWSRVHPVQHTASRRLAERADDLRWERDSSGNWILITRNPDGNPVAVRTERAPSVRTSRRTAAAMQWYHTSPYKLPVGTELTPGGGASHYEPYYKTLGEPDRKNHVWVEHRPDLLKRWHDIDADVNYHYRVEPVDGDPRPYRDGDHSQGWVVPRARIVEDLGPAKRRRKGHIATAAEKSVEQHLRDTYKPYPPGSPNLPDSLKPHLMLPTDIAHHYREYDRPDDENTQMLKRVIADQGIRQPLKISTDGTHALMIEGNHRINVARQLGMTHVPVQVFLEKPGKVMTNSEGSRPVPLEPVLADWIDRNHHTLRSFWH